LKREVPISRPRAEPERMRVHALLLGERLDTRGLERESALAAVPLTIRAGRRGYGVLFRYGAVVLFNLTPAEETEFLATLAPLTSAPLASPETEEADLAVDPSAGERVDLVGTIFVTTLAPERLQVVADVLAKTVVLGYYESKLGAVFERVEPLAAALQRGGRAGLHAKELLREIGDVLLTQHKMVGHVEVLEKPDVLWEHPELEPFHARYLGAANPAAQLIRAARARARAEPEARTNLAHGSDAPGADPEPAQPAGRMVHRAADHHRNRAHALRHGFRVNAIRRAPMVDPIKRLALQNAVSIRGLITTEAMAAEREEAPDASAQALSGAGP
jgi:required for meiotic nuclear division protein 1